MNTRTRLIITGLAIAATVGITSSATATTSRADRCIAPRLVGLTERAAQRTANAAGCVVRLAGARLHQAKIQTVADQTPAAGARTVAVRLTLNPLCFGSALAGPPHDQGMRPGPTELITGLYIVGGPALPYSTPGCTPKPGTPTTGTIEVLDSAGRRLIASRTIAHAGLVTFKLAPGRYRVGGRIQRGTRLFTQPFTIRAGHTTRRYVIEPVP
jgi:hypothetical protein